MKKPVRIVMIDEADESFKDIKHNNIYKFVYSV